MRKQVQLALRTITNTNVQCGGTVYNVRVLNVRAHKVTARH